MTAKRIVRLKARPLIRVLKALERSGIRFPSLAVAGYRLSLHPDSGRVYARSRRAFLGSVGVSGVLRLAPKARTRDVAAIAALVENTLDVARGAAILLGFEAKCPVCGARLDSKDHLRGIGPRCYEKGEFWRLEKGASDGGAKSVRIDRRSKERKFKSKTRRH